MVIDAKYIAGFFDGEGSLGIYRSKNGFVLRTQITQNESKVALELFYHLVSTFCGSCAAMSKKRHNKGIIWQTSGLLAVAFLRTVLPYLRFKKLQATIAIAWETQRPRISRDAKGRMVAPLRDNRLDEAVAQTLKKLKRHPDIVDNDLQSVMSALNIVKPSLEQLDIVPRVIQRRSCCIQDCENLARANGLCTKHYQRLRSSRLN